MKVIVCIKQVPDPESLINLETDFSIGKEEKWKYIVNPEDEVAVGEAVRIRERASQGTVAVITVGPASAEKALRHCLAMGADEAIHLCHSESDYLDPYVTAFILSKAILSLKYDVILCGSRSADWASGAVGSILAELLALPIVTDVINLDIYADDYSAVVTRRLERGKKEVVRCSLPIVFTIEKALGKPIYPTLRAILKASKMGIPKYSVESLVPEGDRLSLEDSSIKLLDVSSCPPTGKIFTPSSDLPPSERVRLMMSGGMTTQKTNLFQGSVEDAAKKVIDFLISRNIIASVSSRR